MRFKNVCLAFARASWREGDSPEEKDQKLLDVPVFAFFTALAGLGAFFRVLDGLHNLTALASLFALFSMTGALAGCFLPVRMVNVSRFSAVTATIAVLGLDWGVLGSFGPGWWPLLMIINDHILITKVGTATTVAVLSMSVLYFVFMGGEIAARFGMYEAANFGDPDGLPPVCDCSNPPCSRIVSSSVLLQLASCGTLLGDFYLTRGFAINTTKQLQIMQASAIVAEELTASLAGYEISQAEGALESPEGKLLPPNLRRSYQNLLQNLRVYRPYIPDSILYHEKSAEPTLEESQGADRSFVVDTEPPGVREKNPEISIVFTDIQSSTALWEQCPQGMFEGLRKHNSALRRVAAENSGYEVKTIGDSFMLAFGSPLDACRFSLQAQERLVAEEWPQDLLKHDLCRKVWSDRSVVWHGPRIRIGVHVGEVRVERNPVSKRADYFGPTVNTASRVEAVLRYGGFTGVTQAVLRMVAQQLEALGSPVVRPLGDFELRGVTEKVAINVVLPRSLAGREMPAGPPAGPHRSPVDQTIDEGALLHSLSVRTSFTLDSRELGPRLQLRASRGTCANVRVALPECNPLEAKLPLLYASVEQAADMTQGLIQTVLSGSVVVTWNASLSVCQDHAVQCLHFVRAIRSHAGIPKIHLGVATSPLLSGNVPGGRRRFATAIGGCIEFAIALSEDAEACGDFGLAVGEVVEHAKASDGAHRAHVWRSGAHTVVVWTIAAEETGSGKWDMVIARRPITSDPKLEAALDAAFRSAVEKGDESKLADLESRDSGDATITRITSRLRKGTAKFRVLPPVLPLRLGVPLLEDTPSPVHNRMAMSTVSSK
eukprot:TRINITY_DN8260_c0_g2_i1.p1 TRINITY_DN8260_c0_g2~~TRINITY_DN8260_c0_g2_i1.p1  ORF type:complete len:850 (+),score=221.06 TRINITY_DN8260_c0_g2_i1:62-2551(+)